MSKRADTAGAGVAGLLLALFAFGSCTRERGGEEYLARVDDARLTGGDVAAATDTSQQGARSMRVYVDDWVVTELLYQEAVRRGLADTDEIRRQLDDTRKHLAIAALMERELFSDSDTLTVTDDAMRAYRDSAGSDFALRSDLLLASYALFAERDAANTFRSWLLGGSPWGTALTQFQRDSALAGHLRQVATRQYFTPATMYPNELWKLARTLRNGEVSFALRTASGYYVVQVHAAQHAGETPDLDFIRPEIRARLLLERRRARYERLLDELRTRHSVEVRLPDGTKQ